MSKKVTLENADVFLGRTIRTAKPYMMPREFIKNSLEGQVKGVPLQINWIVANIGGVRKLALKDNACGMTYDEMVTFSQTAGVSLGTKDASNNFGVGARLTGLRSHPEGVVYYSKHHSDPRVHCTMFHMENGVLCYEDVEEVTGADIPVDLGNHGTIVIFLGRDKAHDTIDEPFEGSNSAGKVSLMKTIILRMFRLRSNVEINLASALQNSGSSRRVRTLYEHMRDRNTGAKYKVVLLPNGIKLHYALFPDKGKGADNRQSMSGATVSGCAGVVFEEELYQCCISRDWEGEAAYFAIDSISERSWVFVELPKKFPNIEPETDRSTLQWTTPQYARPGYEARRTNVHIRNFRKEIIDNMPDFMKAAVKDTRDKTRDEERDRSNEAFRRMMKEMAAAALGPVPDPNGDIDVDDGKKPGPNPGPNPHPHPNPNPKPKPGVKPEPGAKKKAVEKLILPDMIDVQFVADCITGADEPDMPIRIIEGIGDRLPEMRVSEAFPSMKRFKAECRVKLRMMNDEQFGVWWNHAGEIAARATYGRHYITAYVYTKLNRHEDARALFSSPAILTAVSHHYDFMTLMNKAVEAERKLAAVA